MLVVKTLWEVGEGAGFLGRNSNHDLEQSFSLSAREGKVELWEVSAEFALEGKSGSN